MLTHLPAVVEDSSRVELFDEAFGPCSLDDALEAVGNGNQSRAKVDVVDLCKRGDSILSFENGNGSYSVNIQEDCLPGCGGRVSYFSVLDRR